MPNTIPVHKISFTGLAGLIFVTVAASLFLCILGFASTGWSVRGSSHIGLWSQCVCGSHSGTEAWFKATQAMITIGLIFLCFAFILTSIYMCVHAISKTIVLIAVIITCFLSVVFMIIGFVLYGLYGTNLHWAYGLSVVSGISTLSAGVIAIVQLRKAQP